ncbi:MAG: hypothetical protein J1E41_07735, partial [Ruminococcus sp.]|nr:hypothetical protein [Ruminococcus sp.]
FDTSNGDNHLVPYSGYNNFDCIGKLFNFDVKCSGNNIKSITYTANYAKFEISETYYGDIKLIGRDRDGINKACSSFTVDYDNQPDWKECETSNHPINLLLCLNSTDLGYTGNLILKQEIQKYYNYSMHNEGRKYDSDFNIDKYNVKESLEYLYEEMFYGTNVEIEVTYNDGTVESKKMKITYDPEKSSYEKFDPYVIYNID